MCKGDSDDAKKQRLLIAAGVCIEKSKTYHDEVKSLLEAIRLHEDKLRRHRPNWQNLYHAMKRVERKTTALEHTLERIIDTSSSEDIRAIQNLTTEINAELVRWQALKHCSSATLYGPTFNGRTEEQRLRTAKTMIAQRDGVSLVDLEDESQYPTNKGKSGSGGHVCKVNGEICAKEVLLLVRDLATQDSAQVDAVSGGREWLDVRNLLEHRLVEHMNEAGWDWGEYQLGGVVPKEDYEDIPLVRRYKWLCEAAKRNRVDYEIPTLRLCLPSIGREKEEIAILLDQIQRMDPDVKIVIEDKDSWMFQQEAPQAWMERLIKPADFDLTESVVIEMTLINSLISEISHAHLDDQPWHCRQVKAQIAEERRGLRAIETIYPLLQGRRLLVPRSTVDKLRELLKHIGTSRERERAHLIIPDLSTHRDVENDTEGEKRVEEKTAEDKVGKRVEEKVKRKVGRAGEANNEGGAVRTRQEATRQAFSDLSVHEVPSDLQLPFEVIEDGWSQYDEAIHSEWSKAMSDKGSSNEGGEKSPATTAAASAISHILPLIESTHNITTARALLTAWSHDITVVTGNAMLRKEVHQWTDELGPRARGPRIVVSKTCRIMLSAEVGPTKMFYKEDGTVDSQKLREWRMSPESKEARID